MTRVFRLLLLCVFLFLSQFAFSKSVFKDLVIQADTHKYYQSRNTVQYLNEKFLFFKVTSNEEVCEITLHPEHTEHLRKVVLMPSSDFAVLDTFMHIQGEYFRGKIKFNNLSETKFSRLVFQVEDVSGHIHTEEFKLFPFFETHIYNPTEHEELYVSEDKGIDLQTINGYNLRVEDIDWQSTPHVDYKVVTNASKTTVWVHPKVAGDDILKIKFKTIKPYLNEYNQLTYEVPPVTIHLTIKPGRINFLNFDIAEFFLDPSFNKNNEVQIDFTHALGMKRTYRIENQQDPGGKLIAELFTLSQVGNSNKILCWLKTYSLHRKQEGYLFIKDGDQSKFITNFDIIERPRVSRVALLKEGAEDWQDNLFVNPGENIEVRIEGTGLSKAEVQFDLGSAKYIMDTTRKTDNVMFFQLKVPIDIAKRKIAILMNKEFVGYELQVKEYQRPRDFDFISINYDGQTKIPISNDQFLKPVLYANTIEDITLSFDNKKIDQMNKIYGKQIFSIDIKFLNERKDLIEVQKIDNLIICPGENSARYSFYDLKDGQKTSISLNNYLIHKTFDMEGWSTIELTFKHIDSKYSEPGYTRKITLIREKYVLLDMQVSFPTGLLVKKFGEPGFGRFSGVSTAFLAQFSFYDKHKIGKLKSYKVGAGLIALDIFNSNQAQRDLGLVILGSLSPIRSSRFSFPIYMGGGYFIQTKTWFMVFGPGIQFNF